MEAVMTPQQAKNIAKQALLLQGITVEKLTFKTVSFQDLARANAGFVEARGMVDTTPDSHQTFAQRFKTAKACCGGFILVAR
jgi:hypothetical protein